MPTLADLLGPERTEALRETIAANTGRNPQEVLPMTNNTPEYRRVSAADLGHDPDDVCVCTGDGAKGWVRRGDTLWVHSICGRPSLEYLRIKYKGQRETLPQIEAVVEPARPAKESQVPPRHRAAVPVDSPSMVARPTSSDEVDIDPRSEALLQAACADCKADILVEPKVPEHLANQRRVFLCPACAKVRLAGKSGTVTKRHDPTRPTPIRPTPNARVADDKFEPDNITLPEDPMPKRANPKKADINIDVLSDAELGALVRSGALAAAAGDLPARREAAQQAKAAQVAADEARKVEARQARREVAASLGEFVVDSSLTVPALDLDEVADLNVVVSAKQRSVYNKARFRLHGESPLDAETTTFAVLAAEHLRLAEAARARQAEAVLRLTGRTEAELRADGFYVEPVSAERHVVLHGAPVQVKPAEQPAQPVIAANLDLDRLVKVAALVENLGVTKAKAEQMLAEMGA